MVPQIPLLTDFLQYFANFIGLSACKKSGFFVASLHTYWGWAMPPKAEFVVICLSSCTATEIVTHNKMPRLLLPQRDSGEILSENPILKSVFKKMFSSKFFNFTFLQRNNIKINELSYK